MPTSTLPRFVPQSIAAVPVVRSLPIRPDDTVLSRTREILARPVRGLNADPAEPQRTAGSCTPAFATVMFAEDPTTRAGDDVGVR